MIYKSSVQRNKNSLFFSQVFDRSALRALQTFEHHGGPITSIFFLCSGLLFFMTDLPRLLAQVKPLKIIWDKHPSWTASNTLHVDDLARNFALNPK